MESSDISTSELPGVCVVLHCSGHEASSEHAVQIRISKNRMNGGRDSRPCCTHHRLDSTGCKRDRRCERFPNRPHSTSSVVDSSSSAAARGDEVHHRVGMRTMGDPESGTLGVCSVLGFGPDRMGACPRSPTRAYSLQSIPTTANMSSHRLLPAKNAQNKSANRWSSGSPASPGAGLYYRTLKIRRRHWPSGRLVPTLAISTHQNDVHGLHKHQSASSMTALSLSALLVEYRISAGSHCAVVPGTCTRCRSSAIKMENCPSFAPCLASARSCRLLRPS
jgi:hypothetical protein